MSDNEIRGAVPPRLIDIERIAVPKIDTRAFQDAATALETAQQRLAACEAELAAATAVAKGAWEACRRQLDRQCQGDAAPAGEAERAVEEAEGRVTFLRRKVELLGAAVASCQAAHRAAWVEAHRPLHEAGVRIRIAAARLADHARYLLAQTEIQARRGGEMIQQARRQGFGRGETDDPLLVSQALGSLKPESLERETWKRIVA